MWQLTPLLLLLNCVRGLPKLGLRIDPLVETELGLIRGVRSDNGHYSSFLGIPYAVVDEDNPFGESTPHSGFAEPFNAYDSSISCPQLDWSSGLVVGQLQCLTLNVIVPNEASSQNRLPVMIYIHGGAFVTGSGKPATNTQLVEKEVIVVSINYRLGIYGFMCTDSPKAPGNTGLRDQLSALRWINEHIEAFGGDKNRITVFGESAGAMSIHLHILSAHEKLFDRAIIESGPATSPSIFINVDNILPLRISAELGFVTDEVDEALDFIAKANVNLAIAASEKIKGTLQYGEFDPTTRICREKDIEGIERFVTENPSVAISEKAKSIQVIIGYAEQEMAFVHNLHDVKFYDNFSFEETLSYGFDVSDFDDMTDLVKHFYIGDAAPNEKLKDEITTFASDFMFNYPTKMAVDLFLQSGVKAVYQYVFTNVGSTKENSSVATHTEELSYLFDDLSSDKTNTEDQLMTDRMTELWSNFAKYGDPVPEPTDLLPVKWIPVSEENIPYLSIDKDLTLQSRPFHDRMAFWDLFYILNDEKIVWGNKEE